MIGLDARRYLAFSTAVAPTTSADTISQDAIQMIQAMEVEKLAQNPAGSSRSYDTKRERWRGDGHSYTLKDEKGRIILPGAWEDIVGPGEKVTLRFNDPAFNGIRGKRDKFLQKTGLKRLQWWK
jgi:hypothetical protein